MSPAQTIEQEAAGWLLALEDGPLSTTDEAAFEAWMEASAKHKAAFWRMEYAWEEAGRIRALGPAIEDGDQEEEISRSALQRLLRWRPGSILTFALAAVCTAWIAHSFTQLLNPRESSSAPTLRQYHTATGAKQIVGLEDGTKIHLNTQSILRAEMSDERREMWLEAGEAFFDVAHNKDRPFVIHAGDRLITVLGTRFSVRNVDGKVVVSVLEGRVRVDEMQNSRLLRSSVLNGGSIAMADGSSTLVAERSDAKVEDALSGRSGMLTFDQMPLSTIAAEFNRYNLRKLSIVGQELDAIKMSGTFPYDQPEAFARLLRDAYGFSMLETDQAITVSE